MTIWWREDDRANHGDWVTLFLDGWSIFLEYKEAVLVFFLTVMGLGRVGVDLFYSVKDENKTLELLVTFGLGALLLTWSSIFLVMLGRLWPPALELGSPLLFVLCACYLLFSLLKDRLRSIDGSALWAGLALAAALFAYLLLRLAFLSELLLPPYDDSPEHFMIVRDLLHLNAGNGTTFYSLSTITENYYHMGFHSLSAWLTTSSRSDPAMTMALLGQIFLVVSAASMFLLVLALTDNIPAGLVAALFAAFAWKMPAFAANWGKYPAITGLALLPAWLGLWLYSRGVSRKKYASILLFLLFTVGLGLIHTRLFICLAVIAVAWFVSRYAIVKEQHRFVPVIVYSGLTLGVFLLFFKPLAVFYSMDFFLSLGLLILLLPFAVHSYPRYVVVIAVSMLGIWIASRTPVFFGAYGTNWLDAPFVELLLFIPLSLLGGLGFAGLLNLRTKYRVAGVISIVIPLAVIMTAFGPADSFYPDECCNYVSEGDLAAYDWLQQNASEEAVIWTSGFKPHKYMIGTDGGIWMSAFTGRNVNKLDYDVEWDSPSTLALICRSGYKDVYVYQGDQAFSFDDQTLASASWLRSVFSDGGSKIYKAACPP